MGDEGGGFAAEFVDGVVSWVRGGRVLMIFFLFLFFLSVLTYKGFVMFAGLSDMNWRRNMQTT